MSGVTEATGTAGAAGDAEAFAELLRGLKERSGLSYGTLAKRLHMSTSTLHRYCNGSAVPPDYAPVERLARVCRATPEELVELHRRWILADAARGRKAPGRAAQPGGAKARNAAGTAHGNGSAAGATAGEAPSAPAAEDRPADPDGGPPEEPGGTDERASAGDAAPSAFVRLRRPGPPRRPGRPRNALIAAVAAATVLGAVVLAANLSSSGGDGGGQRAGDSGSDQANDERPSASGSPEGGRDREQGGSGLLSVATRPYVYAGPCTQRFLVDSGPGQVGPPASEQDAPRWAAASGAVASGEQRVGLTVEGSGKDTVVLETLHVRVTTKGEPLAWNEYTMGSGCGDDAGTKSFDIDLDSGSPTITTKNGQRDFPYKVNETDPEIFYVTAHTKAHDVRWDLNLEWSSGDRRGTIHIDNDGTPFRTSANDDRPRYHYPPGGSAWRQATG